MLRIPNLSTYCSKIKGPLTLPRPIKFVGEINVMPRLRLNFFQEKFLQRSEIHTLKFIMHYNEHYATKFNAKKKCESGF